MSKQKQTQKDEERKRIMGLIFCFGIIALLFGAMIFTGFIANPFVPSNDGYVYNPEDYVPWDGDVERPDDDEVLPEEDAAEDYTWYQMVFQFVMIDEPEEPFEPLCFTPALGGLGFPTEFNTAIYPVYWYGVPDDILVVPFDSSLVYSAYDYPIETADPFNQNYAIWTSGYGGNYEHSFWFETDLPEWEGEPGVTIYDGGMFISRSYQIPVYYHGIFSDEVLEVGYMRISWILDGTGNHYIHPWM